MRGGAARFQRIEAGGRSLAAICLQSFEGAVMELDFSSLQGVMVIIGPIVLAAVLLWAVLHNKTSRAQKERTEEATRRVREEQNRQDVAQEP